MKRIASRAGARLRPPGVEIGEARASGLLTVSGALVFAASWAVAAPSPVVAGIAPWALSAVPAAAVLAGGLVLVRRPVGGRSLATLGVVGFVVVTARPALAAPALALALWLSAGALLLRLWAMPGPRPARGRKLPPQLRSELLRVRAQSGLWPALLTWFLVSFEPGAGGSPQQIAAGLGFLLAFALLIRWIAAIRTRRPARLAWFVALVLAGLLWTPLAWGSWPRGLAGAGVISLAALVLVRRGSATVTRGERWAHLVERPARLLVLTFLALCIGGTLLLVLPSCSASGTSIGLVDAAFTSVSAVCVTGLIVLDTPLAFNLFGQAVILLLIQLGGLGIMTFATAVAGALGRRLSLRQEGAAAGLTSRENRDDLYRAVRRILLLTFGAEALGWLLLSQRFWAHGDFFPRALWRGLFTSVSAFCNAGFSLQSDSLVGYRHDPWILHGVAVLIVLGGLSPAVVSSSVLLLRRRRASLQTKLVLTSTAILLVLGALMIGAAEWNHSLAGLSTLDRIHNAWFQSVTLRTAGFNSVDITRFQPPAVTVSILWMFIGGSPGGTAGGLKTTTVAILFLAVLTAIRGRPEATAFGRTIPHSAVYKAAAVATGGMLVAVLGLTMVQLTQNLPPQSALFEVISALGTVGLSLGATPRLDGVGKVLIMGCMFTGRVGPLTLFMFLAARHSPSSWGLPSEPVDVG